MIKLLWHKTPLWLKITVPALIICVSVIAVLYFTGVLSSAPSVDESATAPVTTASPNAVIALIAPTPSGEADYIALNGILSSADELGRSIKLYTVPDGENPKSAAQTALDDACAAAILVDIPPSDGNDALSLLRENDIYIVSLFEAYDDTCSVIIDETGFNSDLADFIAEALKNNGVESGVVAVYGDEELTKNMCGDFETVLSPVYTVEAISPGETLPPNTVAIHVTDAQYTASVVELAEENIIITGTDVTADTKELFSKGLYAVTAQPVYEASVQAAVTLDGLMNGRHAESVITLKRHIATIDRVDRYISERYSSLLLFDVITPSPEPMDIEPPILDEVNTSEPDSDS